MKLLWRIRHFSSTCFSILSWKKLSLQVLTGFRQWRGFTLLTADMWYFESLLNWIIFLFVRHEKFAIRCHNYLFIRRETEIVKIFKVLRKIFKFFTSFRLRCCWTKLINKSRARFSDNFVLFSESADWSFN